MAEHADTFGYRDQLIAEIDARRQELGRRALAERPDHIVALLGLVPAEPKHAELWRAHAARIEAYREDWNVPAERITDAPLDGIQYQTWSGTVKLARDLHHIAERAASRSLDRGIERTRGHGLGLG